MDLAPCSNRSAETAGDFVIAKINVRAALRADCGCGRTADLLFSLAFETLDNRAVLPSPQGSKFLANRGILWRGGFFFYISVLRTFSLQTEKSNGRTDGTSSF